MATISIRANTVRPSVDQRSNDTAFLRAEAFSWQDPVPSWKAGPGEGLTVENSFIVWLVRDFSGLVSQDTNEGYTEYTDEIKIKSK